MKEGSETPEYNSDCTEISTCSLVMPVILAKAVFFSEFLLLGENRQVKFVLSQITNLSPERAFGAENTSFLLQFAVSGKLPHFCSDLT